MYEMQQKLAWASLRSGIVISIALMILFLTIFFAGNIKSIFSPKTTIITRVSNIQGLREGAPVWLFGTEIGNVKKIRITERDILMTLSIQKKFIKSIHSDAVAVVMTMGILGDKFVEINQGNRELSVISPGDTINGMNTVGFEQITGAAVTTMAQLDSAISQLTQLINVISTSSGTFSKFLKDSSFYNQLVSTVYSFSSFTKSLSNSKGSMKKFVENPELYNNVNDAVYQLSGLLTQIDNGFGNGGTASALMHDTTMAANLKETIASMRTAANSLNELIADFKKNPKKYLSVEIF